MADLKPVNPINIDERLKDLELFKFHPSALVEVNFNSLSDMLEGRVEILEPNNPISFLLETGGLSTAFGIQQFILETRKLFPDLANTEDDLYKHMSDEDYLNRFSSPSKAKVRFSISHNDYLSKAYVDPVTGDRILTIPRNYSVNIENNIFSTTAPIVIRMTDADVMDIRYKAEEMDNVFPLRTNYIPFETIKLNQQESYTIFDVDLPEIKLEASELITNKSSLLKGSMNFDPSRLFYYFKAYHTYDGKNWEELLTTHTEDVWDIKTPTCIVKVNKLAKKVDYYIPPAYINNGMIGVKVRFICYSTRGAINVDFNDYKLDDFKNNYVDLFPNRENNVTENALNRIAVKCNIKGRVIGGRNEKSFDDLKRDVINNNLRPNLPITDNQIENLLRDTELEPIRDYDVVTGRGYLVKMRIPSNVTKYRVSRMSLDLIEYRSTLRKMIDEGNGTHSPENNVVVIPKGTMFEVDRTSGVRMLTSSEVKNIKSLSGQTLTRTINLKNYMVSHYHYVLNASGEETLLKPYELTLPEIEYINFKDYNDKTMIGINTNNGIIAKTDKGYQLDYYVDVKIIDSYYSVNDITPYIIYVNETGNRFYLEGKLYMGVGGVSVFRFSIDSDFYIDSKDKIHVKNFRDTNGDRITIDLNLTEELNICYMTSNIPVIFEAKEMEELINSSYLTGKFAIVTQEIHKIKFGSSLEHLYSRIHTSTGLTEYKTYDDVVYKKYNETIFDAKTNEIIHRPNDYVLNSKGEKIVVHNIGDIVVDQKGNPVPLGKEDHFRYLNILLMDYKMELGTSEHIDEYRNHVRQTINSLLFNNMVYINEELLERTVAKLTVPNGTTDIMVAYDGQYGYIQPNQSFKVNVYVNQRVHEDDETRKGIERTIIDTIDGYLSGNKILVRTDLTDLLKQRTKAFCKSVNIVKMTELDGDYIKISNDNAEIGIRKRLVVTPDGYDVEDDVTFNFVKV